MNAITLDKSQKTGLVFENVVASCEVVNSRSVEVQCLGLVPTVAIDKVDGCQVRMLAGFQAVPLMVAPHTRSRLAVCLLQLYLSRESLTAAITTAKSSEVNVIIPGTSQDDDPTEAPIPEQFVSTYTGGKWVTKPVDHSGG